MTKGDVVQAKADDAPVLVDLYSKAFRAAGFAKLTTEDKRDELIVWLKGLCGSGKLWVICDEQGPIALGHYEHEKDEVITIATRDGMERNGYGVRMLEALIERFPTLKVRPVTRGGKALAIKCGFVPSESDESLWVRDEPKPPFAPASS